MTPTTPRNAPLSRGSPAQVARAGRPKTRPGGLRDGRESLPLSLSGSCGSEPMGLRLSRSQKQVRADEGLVGLN